MASVLVLPKPGQRFVRAGTLQRQHIQSHHESKVVAEIQTQAAMLNMLRGCYHCTTDLTDFGPDPQTEVLQSFLGGPAVRLPPSSPALPSPGQTKATLQPGWELGRVKGGGEEADG